MRTSNESFVEIDKKYKNLESVHKKQSEFIIQSKHELERQNLEKKTKTEEINNLLSINESLSEENSKIKELYQIACNRTIKILSLLHSKN